MGKLQHVISTKQFSNTKTLEELFAQADQMEKLDKQSMCSTLLNCKIMATLFYEPSTRTRFSFEAAMFKLGGQVISTENAGQFSSFAKGESLEDTIRIVSGYADVIVMRHFLEHASLRATRVTSVPIINAAEGSGEHPTQALLDMYTIKRECGTIDGRSIVMAGDMLYGRTVHSLIRLFALYKGIKMYFCSTPQLRLGKEYTDFLKKKGIPFVESDNLESVAKHADVLYMTRIQKERFASIEEYEKQKGKCNLDMKILRTMKKKAVIMHPLPRVDEIDPAIDADPRAAYFRQAQNGLYIRMALLQMLLT